MENLNSSEGQIQAQVTGKPAAVTVFGVLNCVFGGMGILFAPISIFRLILGSRTMEIVWGYKICLFISSFVGIGFSAWLLSLGIGLLKLKGWARRGSIIYSLIAIVWHIASSVLYLVALSLGWLTMAKGQLLAVVVGIFCFFGGLIYPILLMIFMQTTKVKRAFGQLEVR